jgi:hypothetical protein
MQMNKALSEIETEKVVLCYAEGRGEEWEAFCLDFDLAVQGKSFSEVYQKLEDQIHLYLESVCALPEADRRRLLKRTAPLTTRLSLILPMIWAAISHRDRKERHEYTVALSEIAAVLS